MKHTIIGTAGHVDHGKTTLIKALTGIDSDRLREEKSRGITIDLGFANLDIGNGEKAGIIDVPGHERFVANMLAGAGGIDVALLVVAADESFMPQTQEHLSILSLLGIERGIIALTKIDMIDELWMEMVIEEIRERVRGTFLENAPIMPVSSATGEGVEALRQALIQAAKSGRRQAEGVFRLPIDRVFSMDGFGTVATGTVIEGQISENEEIMIYPAQTRVKVRTIQVHGESVKTAYAGQRAAINLAGIKKSKLQRGDVLAAVDSMQNSMLLDVRLDIVAECKHTILNRSRLHLYHGSKELLCRLILMDRDSLVAGESAYAQLRLEEEIAAKRGDRFVVRFYSPLETVGGGEILDPVSGRRRRNREEHVAGFAIKDGGTLADIVERAVLEHSEQFVSFSEIAKVMFGGQDTQGVIEDLLNDQKIVKIAHDTYMHMDCLKKYAGRLHALLAAYHKENPLYFGMKTEELRTKLFPRVSLSMAENILDALVHSGAFKMEDGKIACSTFHVSISAEQSRMMEEILEFYQASGFVFPETEMIYARYPKNKAAIKQMLDVLIKNGDIVLLNAQHCIHSAYYQQAMDIIEALCAQGEAFTLAQFRDAIGASRKYAVAILEYLDAKKITVKTGDVRKLLQKRA